MKTVGTGLNEIARWENDSLSTRNLKIHLDEAEKLAQELGLQLTATLAGAAALSLPSTLEDERNGVGQEGIDNGWRRVHY